MKLSCVESFLPKSIGAGLSPLVRELLATGAMFHVSLDKFKDGFLAEEDGLGRGWVGGT